MKMTSSKIRSFAALALVAVAPLASQALARPEVGKVTKIKYPPIICASGIVSQSYTAGTRAEAEQGAISAWQKYEGLDSWGNWNLAVNKSLTCQPTAGGGFTCTAAATPCISPRAN
jgi:hypothetical protein